MNTGTTQRHDRPNSSPVYETAGTPGVDFTHTLALSVNSDETYSFAMDINGTAMAAESGTDN